MDSFLLADVGGTNTRIALAKESTICPETIRRFSNAEYKAQGKGLEDILGNYLKERGISTIKGACVAAAGPMHSGVVVMSNLNWRIDTSGLNAVSKAEYVAILNDLQAQGHALGHIEERNLKQIIKGTKHNGTGMLVVGLGTGVNAAPVLEHPQKGRIVMPSECGHVSIPVRSEEELRLVRFIDKSLAKQGRERRSTIEEVLSGRGLVNLYQFSLSEHQRNGHASPSDIITAIAHENDPIANHTARLYVQILAQYLADLALIHLPYQGIFLIGGIARAMSPYLNRFRMTDAFQEARHKKLLSHTFSVTVVKDDYAALTGCALYLKDLYKS